MAVMRRQKWIFLTMWKEKKCACRSTNSLGCTLVPPLFKIKTMNRPVQHSQSQNDAKTLRCKGLGLTAKYTIKVS